jgi:hypothetical protein
MAFSHHDATTDGSGNPPRGTLIGYFVRYRLALYSFREQSLRQVLP